MPKKAEKQPKKIPKAPVLKIPQLLRGFKDILPAEQNFWRFICQTAENFSLGYGFSRIYPPIL